MLKDKIKSEQQEINRLKLLLGSSDNNAYRNAARNSLVAAQAYLDECRKYLPKDVEKLLNPQALASVRRGLSDATQGKVSKVDIDTL